MKKRKNLIESRTLCVCVSEFVCFRWATIAKEYNNQPFAKSVSAKTYYHDMKSDALLPIGTIPNGFRVHDIDLVFVRFFPSYT